MRDRAGVAGPRGVRAAARASQARFRAERVGALIPSGKPHLLGRHNPRVPNRDAMTAILFVLRTGSQWNALKATGIRSSSSAHRRFVEWTEAGVFEQAWVTGLADYDEFVGVDWRWLSMDGAMTKAPLGGEKTGPNPHRPGEARHQAQLVDRGQRRPPRHRRRRSTATTSSWRVRPSRASSSPVPRRRAVRPRASASTRATTTARCVSWPTSFVSPRTSDAVAKRPTLPAARDPPLRHFSPPNTQTQGHLGLGVRDRGHAGLLPC
jgi:transposase